MAEGKGIRDDGTIPRFETFVTRHNAKVLGFAAGVLGPLLLAGLLVVVWTGHGIGEVPPKPDPVFTVY